MSLLNTVADYWRYAVSAMEQNQVFYGHGYDNPVDEARFLIAGILHLPLDSVDRFSACQLELEEQQALRQAIVQRTQERIPSAYIVGHSYLQGYRFRVNRDVLIPRSHLAQWLVDSADEDSGITKIADLGTGSGCLAIIAALLHDHAQVDAIDISAAALAVAQANISDYGLEGRVQVQCQSWLDNNSQRYDVIVANPPYVATAYQPLPAEYQHEPQGALFSGELGLDAIVALLQQVPHHLTNNGVLALECGSDKKQLLEQAFPDWPWLWLDYPNAEATVAIVHAQDIQ